MKEHTKQFIKQLNKARKLNEASYEAQRTAIKYINDILFLIDKDVDSDISPNFQIAEVITTYVSYGDVEHYDDLIKLLESIK